MEAATSIDFFCALCGSRLAVSAEHAGGIVECPQCSRSIPVPGPLNHETADADYLPVFQPEILAVEMSFVCPGCDRVLIADARYEGAPFTCPKCATESLVPHWSGLDQMEEAAVSSAPFVVLSPEEIDFLSGEPIGPPASVLVRE